jgi:heme/copper-type cytochrome/quinol oxidase subunit 1
MTTDRVLRSACGLLFIGLSAGLLGQIELMRPGILFLSETAYLRLVQAHLWLTPLALGIICLVTLPMVGRKGTVRYWILWGLAAATPLLNGLVIHLMLSTLDANAYLHDTVYTTANRHAYGIVGLCVALGGISVWQTGKGKSVPLKFAIPIAVSLSISAFVFIIFQASLGLNGMPRRYVDYPEAFALLQFYASLSAITCLSLAGLYLVLLWRRPDERAAYLDDVF